MFITSASKREEFSPSTQILISCRTPLLLGRIRKRKKLRSCEAAKRMRAEAKVEEDSHDRFGEEVSALVLTVGRRSLTSLI